MVRRVHHEHFPRPSDTDYRQDNAMREVLTLDRIGKRLGITRYALQLQAERALENFILGFAGVRLSDAQRNLFDDAPAIEGTIERYTDEHVEWNEAAMEELTRLGAKIVEVA